MNTEQPSRNQKASPQRRGERGGSVPGSARFQLPACPECLTPSTQDACAPSVTQRKTGREKPFQPGKKLSIYSIGDTEGRRLTELAQSTGRRIPSFRVL